MGLPELRSDMNKKRLWLSLALGLVLVLLCAGTALAAGESLKYNMELSSSVFTEPKTITISFTVTNIGEKELPGPVTLYYPSGKQVEEFGAPVLSAGSSKNWSGPWSVTQKELDAGAIGFIVRFTDYDENGELKTYAITVKKRIQFSGAEPELDITRTIVPQVAQEGQEVSVIYEITNKGPADISNVSIKEKSIAKDSGTIEKIAAGETGKYVFTVKMGKKDLSSEATVTYKAGGKTYNKKVEASAIKYGKVNLSATLSADKKGGAPGDVVKLTLKLKNAGTTDFTNVTVTDEKLGTLWTGETVPAGQTVTLEKDLTITETQDLLFTVKADDGTGSQLETATGTVKVIATDPTQQIVLEVEAKADRDHVYIIPGGVVRFTITVTNKSAVDVKNVAIRAIDTQLYTFENIPHGESRSFTRDMEISMAGSFQFSANVKDQLDQTVTFLSNVVPIAYAAPTAEPTATPLVTPPAPAKLTYPPETEAPQWIAQAENIADSAKYILAGIAGVLAVLLLIGAVRRMAAKNQSRKAMDHLEGGAYRDYSVPVKDRRRSEITSGREEKPEEKAPEKQPEENTAQSSELMAETLRRLYNEPTPVEEATVVVTEEAEKPAAEAEAPAEAAEDATVVVKDDATVVTKDDATVVVKDGEPAAQSAGEAAHRRRARNKE